MSDQLAILNNGQQRNLFLQELISHAAVSLSGAFFRCREYPKKCKLCCYILYCNNLNVHMNNHLRGVHIIKMLPLYLYQPTEKVLSVAAPVAASSIFSNPPDSLERKSNPNQEIKRSAAMNAAAAHAAA